MPDYIKISELPAASSVALTDQLELNQAGTSRSTTAGLLVGVYQTVSVQSGAMTTGTTVIPFDDTIPQIGEGTEFMTLAITPKSATSKLIIEATVMASPSVACTVIVALFQGATANALAATANFMSNAGNIMTTTLRHVMTSGTTGSTTFRVRIGPSLAGTITFNGVGGARSFGGVLASGIVIREVAP